MFVGSIVGDERAAPVEVIVDTNARDCAGKSEESNPDRAGKHPVTSGTARIIAELRESRGVILAPEVIVKALNFGAPVGCTWLHDVGRPCARNDAPDSQRHRCNAHSL